MQIQIKDMLLRQVLLITLNVLLASFCQAQSLHKLTFKDSMSMQKYFAYNPKNMVIISGHRGGMVKGFPENSIETFENTLKHYPAFFEIDPRLTKDSVVVLLHDATLDRTTNGTGKLIDHTYLEIQQLRLKDPEGNVTNSKIPTLEEAIKWSKGKTVMNLDHKNVPLAITAKLLDQYQNDQVMLTVHRIEQAQFYLKHNPNWMLSVHILNQETFDKYNQANINWKNIIAYIGPKFTTDNLKLMELLHEKGVRCMISTAPSDDKLVSDTERAEAYRKVARQGADVIESDLPIELGDALKKK